MKVESGSRQRKKRMPLERSECVNRGEAREREERETRSSKRDGDNNREKKKEESRSGVVNGLNGETIYWNRFLSM